MKRQPVMPHRTRTTGYGVSQLDIDFFLRGRRGSGLRYNWGGSLRVVRRLGIWAVALLWAHAPVLAAPIPFADREAQLTAREQPIADFMQDLFGRIDVPVVVSPSVRGAVNGSFSGPAERTFRSVARAFNIVEYYDGNVLYLYTPTDLVTRTLPVAPALAARVVRTVAELRLGDARNSLRTTREGTLIASGTRRFVEQVEELTRAQAVSERTGTPQGFKVFYLRYAWAQDVNINFGGRQVALPGVASIVRALMTSNAKSQVSVTSYETPAPATVAGIRGQRSQRAVGTLGGPGADVGAPSAPVLAALATQAPGRNDGGAGAALAPQPLVVAADPSQVRVEADARLNAVVVRDAPDRLPLYEQLIAALDVEPQALEIEATIIDLNTDRLRELGINWRYTRGDTSLLFGRGDASDLSLRPNIAPGEVTPSGVGGFISAVLNGPSEFIARINALEQQGAARVVSSPQVMTLSNVEAVFDNSSTFYVRVAGRDEVDLFNVSAGTTLRVTPHVFKDNGQVRIKMLVNIDDGTLSTRTVDTLPVVNRSSVNTQALIFEGESLLVGGIVRESNTNDETKVPFLGDIPVIGALFRNRATSNGRVERLFLIQPRLSRGGRTAAQMNQLGLPAPAATGSAPANAVLPPPAPATGASEPGTQPVGSPVPEWLP
jgi:type III secretion protein C